jgi:exopolysaccharide production protein ExoQ
MIAVLLCMVFVAYLFWTDTRRPEKASMALWAPIAWIFLAGSRWVSSWLSLGSNNFASSNDYAEGSPVDAAAFLSLILLGLAVLARRKVDWVKIFSSNIWLVLYFLFCLSSIAWTDEPFTLLKRWIKDMGNPIMALVILTEPRPYEAVGIVLRRVSFLLLPFSILFVKYFPELGRAYRADGSPMFTGIGHQKNDLGLMCLLAGLYAFWELLRKREPLTPALSFQSKLVLVMLIVMLSWLLHMSDSQTSLVCLSVSIAILLLARAPFISRRPTAIFSVLLLCGGALWLLDATLGLRSALFEMLGRNPTLTNRTEVWDTLRKFEVNPIIGAGFMSFWAGERLDEIWKLLGSGINQAHNGYFEQYLNLGYIGVAFILIIIIDGLVKVRKSLRVDFSAGLLRMCFIVSGAFYNVTEASFYGINNMWVLLLLGCIDIPTSARRVTSAPRVAPRELVSRSRRVRPVEPLVRQQLGKRGRRT